VPKYQYNGDSVLEFPTLGVTVSKGDQFDGPDGITAEGVAVVAEKAGKATPKIETPEETPAEEVN
jgi:hypothetical protein